LPRVSREYQLTTWCPRAIKEKEGRSFALTDNIQDGLKAAINTEGYEGSLKLNFFEKEPIEPNVEDDRLQMRR